VVFVHSKAAEERFLSEGFGVKRYPVMYNDFVLIGPENDPAGVKGKDIVTALQTIRAVLAGTSRWFDNGIMSNDSYSRFGAIIVAKMLIQEISSAAPNCQEESSSDISRFDDFE
jgi:hypothetical protein